MRAFLYLPLVLFAMMLFLVVAARADVNREDYPAEWWVKIPEKDRKPWEILPQDAGPGEVILSKRTELGIFSNLAHTPVYFEGVTYESVEAFWQMMKYPDPKDPNDPRAAYTLWPYERFQVIRLFGFDAKDAGDMANQINKKLEINWVSYKQKRFNYKDNDLGTMYHFHLISKIVEEKVKQNPPIAVLLEKTKGLKLRLDHNLDDKATKSYYVNEILMEIRDQIPVEVK